MTGDDTASIVYALLCLMLVGSALAARRLPLAQTAKMAAAWIAIFAVVGLLYGLRDDITGLFRRAFMPETGVVAGETLRIPMAEDGHFWVRGRVNNHETRFLVDSGASITALSSATAEAAAVTGNGQAVTIDTANGTVAAQRVRIGTLTIGPIVREDVSATTARQFGELNVLGMNFLSSLTSWGVEGRTLVLRP